jgi:hypothetical protein
MIGLSKARLVLAFSDRQDYRSALAFELWMAAGVECGRSLPAVLLNKRSLKLSTGSKYGAH